MAVTTERAMMDCRRERWLWSLVSGLTARGNENIMQPLGDSQVLSCLPAFKTIHTLTEERPTAS